MKFTTKLSAILLALLLILSAAACTPSDKEEDTTAATTEAVIDANATTLEDTTVEDTLTADDTTDVETTLEATTAAATLATSAATKAPATTVKPAATTKPVATKPGTTTTAAPAVAVPTDKAAILKLYNDAAAKLSTSKPSFSKLRKCNLQNLNMGALAKLDVVRGAVGDFLGEGTSTTNIKKGAANSSAFVKSKLNAADVTKATCKLSADKKYYEITLTVKNETNLSKKTSSLGKFTNDYKDIDEIKAGLKDVGASVENITLKTTSVVITAKISVADSKFASVRHNYKMYAVLTKVKYTIVTVKSATSDLVLDVNYSNFKY